MVTGIAEYILLSDMVNLSDGTIRAKLADGTIEVEPMVDLDAQLQPGSLDLRLGHEITDMRTGETHYIEEWESFRFEPGVFYLASTLERVSVPADIQAHVNGRSSIGRKGLIVHATAGIVDAGWDGELTLEVTNLGHEDVILTPRQRVCQLEFVQLDKSAEQPYGDKDDAKYQGQTGPTESKLDDDVHL
jgi:dCTP deaminase